MPIRLSLVLATGTLVGAVGWAIRSALRTPQLEVVSLRERSDDSPAMCPWREPKSDLPRFFPAATSYRTELIVLSRKRVEILRRLGGRSGIPSNALYVYPVSNGHREMGLIAVRRVAGSYGALEVVLAVGLDYRVLGLRIQRHREPPKTAALFNSATWQIAFRNKDALSPLKHGLDLPVVAPESAKSAGAVADAVRALLIELDVAGEERAAPHH